VQRCLPEREEERRGEMVVRVCGIDRRWKRRQGEEREYGRSG
jgi:hypothetical protein